jgi:CelD/BcsL family acetyltransferase involved in cellulose biosynthesis
MPLAVAPQPVTSFAALGAAWRALEAAAEPSFFQSWTWVGCLAEERYPDPVLLRAERDGRTVGLALFNRRRGRLHLAETGEAELDRPFTEHNAPLATDPEAALALLRAAWTLPGISGLVLGGVPPALAEAAGGVTVRRQLRPAPWLDLDALRARGGDLLAGLSANARYQIRRSDRLYAGEGRLAMARAATEAERAAWMEELTALHEATWRRRGQPGAFATPYLRRFHAELTARALARGELDLLRVTGPAGVVGLLYNLRHGGRVLAYQSGFADPAGQAHARPGLTCHVLAIGMALARGDRLYDFLAGDQRYKRSLADRSLDLAWVELARPWSAAAFAAGLRRLAGRFRRG